MVFLIVEELPSGPLLLLNREESIIRRGRNVGRQAEMIPMEHSTTHQVQAVDNVHDISEAWNWNSVVNR